MMSKKKSKKALVPALRFSGFSEEWEERTLGNIAEVLSGYGFPEKFQGKAEGKYPFYKVSDISSSLQRGEVFLKKAANYIDDDVLQEIRATLIPVGATVFAKIGEALRLNRRAIISIPSLVDNNVAALKGKKGEATDLFVYYIMSGIDLADHSGGAVPSVNKSTLESIPVYCPTVKEQQKIADCLSSLDEVIGLQGRKVEALKAHKKALMQSLFPAPGSSTPTLRFAGFKGEWKEKALGDVCEILNNRRQPVSSSDRVQGEYPYYGASGIVDYISDFIFDERLLLVGEDGAKWGAFEKTAFIADGKYWVNNHAHVLKPKEVLDSLIENYLTMIDLSPFVTGAAPPKLTLGKLKEIPIPFPPTKDEQQAIADCLSSADDVITSQAQKLTALKEHKKGLMQQLFPSLDEEE